MLAPTQAEQGVGHIPSATHTLNHQVVTSWEVASRPHIRTAKVAIAPIVNPLQLRMMTLLRV